MRDAGDDVLVVLAGFAANGGRCFVPWVSL